MAVAESFFSTLVQSTAAIISFTIALAAALYTSRLEKIRHQTETLRGQLIEIQDEYKPVLSGMSTTILEDSEFSTDEITPDVDSRAIIDDSEDMREAAALLQYEASGLDVTDDEIKKWAEEQPNKHAALLWAHIQRTKGILDEISPLTENLLTQMEMARLFQSVRIIKDTLNVGTDSSKALYQEVTGESHGRGVTQKTFFLKRALLSVGWIEI